MITATIIARDEADCIARCLESLSWVDQIVVVVDDRTLDDTYLIAQRYTQDVHVRPFRGYSDQRQWAAEMAGGEWILCVDCDEIVPGALQKEIVGAIAENRHTAYRIPHLDYMFGKWIRHGGWYPQYHIRLFQKRCTHWSGDVHEKPIVTGSIGTLETPLLHFSHTRVSDWVEKMSRYSTLEAQAIVSSGGCSRLWHILLEPIGMFGYKFVAQQGWRDGMHGLTLAMLLACSRLVRNLKVWDLTHAGRMKTEFLDDPRSLVSKTSAAPESKGHEP